MHAALHLMPCWQLRSFCKLLFEAHTYCYGIMVRCRAILSRFLLQQCQVKCTARDACAWSAQYRCLRPPLYGLTSTVEQSLTSQLHVTATASFHTNGQMKPANIIARYCGGMPASALAAGHMRADNCLEPVLQPHLPTQTKCAWAVTGAHFLLAYTLRAAAIPRYRALGGSHALQRQ